METPNKALREQREFQTLFGGDATSARQNWSKEIVARLAKPALPPIAILDRDGRPTPESLVEQAVWDHLCQELAERGESRNPTEGEMMDACQQYYARHSSSSYVARRDSAGAKPVDETKQNLQVNNPLEGLSDEELQVMYDALLQLREGKEALPDAEHTTQRELVPVII